jgi:hypothetical protein
MLTAAQRRVARLELEVVIYDSKIVVPNDRSSMDFQFGMQ